MYQYVWLLWSLGFLAIWGVLYVAISHKEEKKEMFWVSLFTAPLGLLEPLFIPDYWLPPSLFHLAETIQFDIEALIFAFAVGGIASVIYERTVRARHIKVIARRHKRGRYHIKVLVFFAALAIIADVVTGVNLIYTGSIALVIGGIFILFKRPDLFSQMLGGSVIFLGLYFVMMLTLDLFAPGYIQAVWNLDALSGILFVGVPIEELMFASTLGFFWSGIYEYATDRRLISRSAQSA